MINRGHTLIQLPSFLPKFGDQDVVRNVITTDFYRHLYLGENGKAGWLLLKTLMLLKLEIITLPLRVIMRHSIGMRTIGLMICLLSLFMLLGLNAHHPIGLVFSFLPFLAPLSLLVFDSSQIWSLMIHDIRSANLLGLIVLTTLFSVIHLMRAYVGKTNINPGCRGTSWLHTLVFGRFGISKKLTHRLVEPFIISVIALGLFHFEVDIILGMYLLVSAILLGLQEAYDGLMQFVMKP